MKAWRALAVVRPILPRTHPLALPLWRYPKSPHDLSGHQREMKCWRVVAGCGRRTFLAAACAPRVWCGTVGTSECRSEHEPEIPLHAVVLSR
jgi:hypothetical protein